MSDATAGNVLWGLIKLGFITGLLVLIIIRVFIVSGRAVIEANWNKYKCNPMVIPFANQFGHNVMTNAQQCTQVLFKTLYNVLHDYLADIMGLITGSLGNINSGMNFMRFAMVPVRLFLVTVGKLFYNELNMMIRVIVYYFSKIRDILRKMSAYQRMNLYTLKGTQITFNQLMDGAIGSNAHNLYDTLADVSPSPSKPKSNSVNITLNTNQVSTST